MLTSFIRRNGKRKNSKGKGIDQSQSQSQSQSQGQTTTSVSTSSPDPSPRVLDIGDIPLEIEESSSSIVFNNTIHPLVPLELSTDSEEWFPQELLQGGHRPRVSLVGSHSRSTPTLHSQGQHSQSSSSLSYTPPAEDVSMGLHVRKKSIPAPIFIPETTRLLPNVQIGHSAPSSSVPPPSSAGPPPAKSTPQSDEAAAMPPPSPSSENLSAVSGTTLARALIANSFILSSLEHRKSRHRSGMARQDSATLPRGETLFDKRTSGAESTFSSDSARPLSIPPVPPLPLVPPGPFLHPKMTPGLMSGSSISTDYPLSTADITSPAAMSKAGRRISRIQEVPSPAPSTPSLSATLPAQERTGFPARGSPHTHKSSTSDVPSTASDLSSPLGLRPGPQESSQAESFTLSSADHSLDEFDFVPIGPQQLVSPGLHLSASFPSPRRDASQKQRRRRDGGTKIVTSTLSEDIVTDNTVTSRRHNGTGSAVSDHDFGELRNYPLTVSPSIEVTPSRSTSSVSAGYQTFPETPALFTPVATAGFVAKSDSQWPRSLRVVSGRGAGKFSRHGTLMGKKGDNISVLQRSKTANVLLPIQKTPSPKPEKASSTPSPQPSPKAVTLEDTPSPTADAISVEKSDELQILEHTEAQATEIVEAIEEVEEDEEGQKEQDEIILRHPLAHISSSSSKLQAEEVLRAFAQHSRSSLPSMMLGGNEVHSSPPKSPRLVPLPDSVLGSPASLLVTESVASASPSTSAPAGVISQPQPKSVLAVSAGSSLHGSSFLPSPSPSPSPLTSLREPRSTASSPAPLVPHSRPSSDHSMSPSYIAPPPYHAVVSERTSHHPLSPESQSSLSRAPSADAVYHRSREPSVSNTADMPTRVRVRSRPRLPGGPRKPSGMAQQPLVPNLIRRNGSVSSVATHDRPSSPAQSSWPKLYAAASKPPPRFHTPAPKWRGLTMEAAQWTFTSDELQSIVSRAIQVASEGSSIRLLRHETLEGEIAEETHRLEMQRTDVKAKYKALVRKRWTLLGAMAGHVEGVEMNDTATAIQTIEELAEVSLALDQLVEKLHDTIEQLAQLRSLREVHSGSALAMALRKMHHSFVRQMAEKERLMEQVGNLQSERDEAWKHAETVAKDCDELNDRLLESTAGEVQSPVNDDALSFQSNRRSERLSAIRKSSVRLSQAGLRSRSRPRSRHSSFNGSFVNAGPSAPSAEYVPPVPALPTNPDMSTALSVVTALPSGSIRASFTSPQDSSDPSALVQAQREVYEMLGMSMPPSEPASRPRTISDPQNLRLGSRPVSDSGSAYPVVGLRFREKTRRATGEGNRAIRSVILDDR